MIPTVEDFEQLGLFYLGRKYDLPAQQPRDELLLYDSKDLCTHALCVGMTGSGKTGLCLALLEEAAIDSIPIICVDPKGDLANLLLAFPDLRPQDFEPWLQDAEAMRRGQTKAQFAAQTAAMWREGLAVWGQGSERIARFKNAAEATVYTPGSSAGIPLTVLRSFDAPAAALLEDSDAMRERVTGAASGLLTLLGVDADPILSREHILVASILDRCWREGRDVSVADMIGLIQTPPFDKVGVLGLEAFMSATQRGQLAMRLNNLLASPAFSTWMEGESLNVQRLLYTADGAPRISILSIAHLSDAERMFFVTILLNELVTWMRSQSGTSSLRAIFYMDEVFGYFPPTAKPPSKQPMLTLLKQARAYGLGIVLATQNPVDLDYKGLANIGTWFLGRLQTERDKQRVLEGLEGAAAHTGHGFDRGRMEQILSGLGSRRFLVNNVHNDHPEILQTRWAMSFLAGPLSRDQIATLMQPRKDRDQSTEANKREANDPQPSEPQPSEPQASDYEASDPETSGSEASEPDVVEGVETVPQPVAPVGVQQRYLVNTIAPVPGHRCVYRPAVLCEGSLHYVRASAGVDDWRDQRRLVLCGRGVPNDFWQSSQLLGSSLEFEKQPADGFQFTQLPAPLCDADQFKAWEKAYKDYLYRHHPLVVFKSPLLKEYAPAGTTIQQARLAFSQRAREARDRETEKLREKYVKKMESLDRKISSAQARLVKERGDLTEASVTSVIDLGASLLGSLFGSRRGRPASRASTVVRKASRTAKEHGDVKQVECQLTELRDQMVALDDQLRVEINQLAARYAVQNLVIETTEIAPRKGDLKTTEAMLVWVPWQIGPDGSSTALVPGVEPVS
jgi:hypothetical protein